MKKRPKRVIYPLLGLCVAWLGLVLFNNFGTRPAVSGLTGGRLNDCPSSPNCVCSQASRAGQQIEPVPFSGSVTEAMSAILATVQTLSALHIETADERYVHATARTLLLRFVDDVEFLIDETDRVIHLRSASRIGYSDMGANARRVNLISAELRRRLD
jgi:uncharacterized protein (DUF1499 family)